MGPLWISRITEGLNRETAITRVLSRVYGAGLSAFSGARGIPWATNGEPIRIDPRMRGKVPPQNEPALFNLLKAGIKPGQVIFDVGTFIGTYAVFEARWSGSTGRVVAFEPTAKNWPRIEAHLRMNGVDDRVELIKAAAGDRSGVTRFHQHITESDQNSVFPLLTPADSRLGEVPMVTLDEIAERLNVQPDWIRMDVQGFELSVLRGARKILARRGKDLRIVVEMHPGIWALNGLSTGDIEAGLHDLGLTPRPIEPSAERLPDGHVELLRI